MPDIRHKLKTISPFAFNGSSTNVYANSKKKFMSIPPFSSRVTAVAPDGSHGIGACVVTHPNLSTALNGSFVPLKRKSGSARDPLALLIGMKVARAQFLNSGIRRSLLPERVITLVEDMTPCMYRSGVTPDSLRLNMRLSSKFFSTRGF